MRKKIWELILAQLRQGATPKSLALAVALGVMLGNFPLMGTTTVLCVIVGAALRLNQPVLQAANYAMLISQLVMIPILLWVGETVTGAEHLSLDPEIVVRQFFQDKVIFFEKFGMAGVHAVLGWCLVAPVLGWIVYAITEIVFRRASQKLGIKI